MGKSRQRGWVVLRGRKWYGYYRRSVLDPITNEQKVDVIPIVLGPKSRLTKTRYPTVASRIDLSIASQRE